jgi:hypothetical protein
LTREDVIAFRISAQQLDRAPAARPLTDAAVFDLGVQDTGRDAASWALVNRGVPVASPEALATEPSVGLVWGLRAAPHFYRRADLFDVLVATSPFSDADAAKRILGADQPLKAAGIPTRDAMAVVAAALRRIVDEPVVKGEVSTRLTAVLDPPYLRKCVPCNATHAWEMPFRLGALYGGLELEPGTSPRVLRRIPDWPRRKAGPAADPLAAPERLQPIRSYLRLLGPATPSEVAAYLDATLADVKAHWPTDAVEVTVEGKRAWALGEVPGTAPASDLVRLLGPFDLLLQGKDRALLVPDRSQHKALWPILGRPGAILSGTDIIGGWRPKTTGKNFTVRIDLWTPPHRAVQERIEEQASLLAAHRGLAFAGLTTD